MDSLFDIDSIFDIDLVLKGLTGMGSLLFFLGMLYFGFILMRARPGNWERVFFWSAAGQLVGLFLVAAVSLAAHFFGSSFMDGGGVNWAWVGSSVCKGLVILCSLAGAVALVGSSVRGK
jgi:hypothetical protein